MVEVNVETMPLGASVFVDNIDYDIITPTTLDLAEGPHTYILRIAPRYEDISGQISVLAGNSYTIIATLKETTIAMQQAFNDNMVKIGWYSFIIGASSLLVGLLKKKS